jgi:ferredoxin-NADP reductase
MDLGFSYLAGQFLTFRLCGTLRSYSMSSSPDTDGSLAVTVKRVPGGLVSGWMHEHLGPGDVVEVTRPAGVFCLRDTAAPMVAFGAGSGITPILSLVKSALAVTARRVRVLTANRDWDSVIFRDTLDELAGRYPGRLEVRHHLDEGHGFVTGDQVRAFAGGDRDADFYICGPAPFMDLAERAPLDDDEIAESPGSGPVVLAGERLGAGLAAGLAAALLSPLHANLHGLPPIQLLAAGNDVLVDDSLAFATRAARSGVTVDLRVRSDEAELRAGLAPALAAFVGERTAAAPAARIA